MSTPLSRRDIIQLGAAASLLSVACPRTALAAAPAGSVEHTVSLPAIPKGVEAFLKMRDEIATTPFGGAAMFVLAALVYSQDETEGLQALTTMIDSKWLADGTKGYRGKQPSGIELQRFKDRWSKARGLDYVPRSYVQGTSPQGEYKIPSGALIIKIREQTNSKESDSSYKVFVHSTGADSPRPIQVKKNSAGVWKAYEWSSLTSGVRKPEVKVEDDI